MEKQYVEIILLLFAAIEFVWALYIYIQIREAKDWNMTEGLILKSSIHKMQMASESKKSYRIKIEYTYQWQGHTYHSKRVYFGDYTRLDWSLPFKKILSNYQEGSKISVYFDPKNPKESVLIRNNYMIVYLYLFSALIFFIAFLVVHFAF